MSHYRPQRYHDPEPIRCSHGCGARFASYQAHTLHAWQAHRATMVLREIRHCEQAAKHEADQSDEAWRSNLYARRYRALLRTWWKLSGTECSRALSDEGKPPVYLTRLGEPRGYTPRPAQWTLPWLRQVRQWYPDAWQRVQAHSLCQGEGTELRQRVLRVEAEPL